MEHIGKADHNGRARGQQLGRALERAGHGRGRVNMARRANVVIATNPGEHDRATIADAEQYAPITQNGRDRG